MTPLAIALLAMGAVFTMCTSLISGVMLFRIESRARRESGRDATLAQLAGDVRSLREGMSIGAERAFTGLAGRVGVLEDDAEETLRKLTELRADHRALDRVVEGHIRTPGSHAHPPPGFGPVPA
jgi:hypothetical protein